MDQEQFNRNLETIRNANPKLAELMEQGLKKAKSGQLTKGKGEYFLKKAVALSPVQIPNIDNIMKMTDKLK